ncbi:MAG: cysteine--tRNA ligase [Myxococcales bacterium]|jgi:cysteinyl-tRNA synthetase|nr:cysteine--tRNA ligase [Myxococcales bacterium]
MALVLHDTLSGRRQPLASIVPGKLGLYVCGVTVYDRCHIGHARSLVFFDMLVRYLRFAGYEVTFVRNITDIDDKIIKRAAEETIPSAELASRYIGTFRADVAALGCLQPDVEPRATDHIPEMLDLIARLEKRGIAYASGGDVYCSVARIKDYGKLSKRKLEDLIAGARVEVGERKREGLDFALWKAAKPGEPFWESPWGPGRPGWHLECSAMSTRYLGQPFDLHGGGEDLIFPHHENEIAQSEGATGTPFVNHWVHHAFVRINEEKMSKSLGNFLTIEEVLKRVPAEVLRLFLVATHYRSPVDFSDQSLIDAQRACARLHEALARIEEKLGAQLDVPRSGARSPDVGALATSVRPFHEQFVAAMDDDLNSARALGVVFDEVREINRLLDAGVDLQAIAEHHGNLSRLGAILGVLRHPAAGYLEAEKGRRLAGAGLDPAEIERLIADRAAARRAKDFKRGDAIRDELLARGIVLKDSASGTTWSVVDS